MALNPQVLKKIKSLSVVIPAYNEEKIIKKNILLLNDILKTSCEDYEIIVVDDGSTDNTATLLKELTFDIKELKVLRNEMNQKLGSALRKGFSIASKELVFYTDADMPIDYSEIYRACEVLELSQADLIVGVRRKTKSESALRALCSLVYNRLIEIVFNIKIKDINFACKLIRKCALEELNLKSKGSFIDAEMVIKANYLGYKIRQIDVNYFNRQDRRSRLFKLEEILFILFEMIRYYSKILNLRKRDEKIFNS